MTHIANRRRRFLLAFSLLLILPFTQAVAMQINRFDMPYDDSPARTAVDRLVAGDSAVGVVPGAAFALLVDGQVRVVAAAGCAAFEGPDGNECARPMAAQTKMRMASISKMVMALAVHDLAGQGLIDLDADVSDTLGWSFRNPAFPDQAITLRQLLSHTAGLRDPEKYWVPAPGLFQPWFQAQSPFADQAPGAYFAYANINSPVIATIVERVTGKRFDRLMAETLFQPLGLDVGFNWAGISPDARRAGASLYRKAGDGWAVSKDGPDDLADLAPTVLAEPGTDLPSHLNDYQPGENASLFSPQGGLRASVVDLVRLGQAMARTKAMQVPAWTLNQRADNGAHEAFYFDQMGPGTQIITGTPAFHEGYRFTGHGGEAYGLYSGVWMITRDRETGFREPEIIVAYAVNGTEKAPARGRHPATNALDEIMIDAAFAAMPPLVDGQKNTAAKPVRPAPEEAHQKDREPRPYDKTRDAMADVEAVLARARESGRKPLLVLGANWCHDSRDLAARFEKPEFASLIDRAFELVYVDVGQRDRNLDVARRFGVHELIGTPTVLVLSSDGNLLNGPTVSKWKRAASISDEETYNYFSAFADIGTGQDQ